MLLAKIITRSNYTRANAYYNNDSQSLYILNFIDYVFIGGLLRSNAPWDSCVLLFTDNLIIVPTLLKEVCRTTYV